MREKTLIHNDNTQRLYYTEECYPPLCFLMECASCGIELTDDIVCLSHADHCQDCCTGMGDAVGGDMDDDDQ